MQPSTQHRRRSERVALDVYFPAIFDVKGKKFSAVMRDLSVHGGGFRTTHEGTDPGLRVGDRVEAKVWTSHQTSRCAGRVAWTSMFEDHIGWGIEFSVALSNSPSALRELLRTVQ